MRGVTVCLVALVLTTGAASAQENTAEIRGRALDAQDAVLPGVTITATNQATGIFRETVTNADGTYFIPALTPGQFEIAAELNGFKRYLQRDIRLDLGRTTTLDVRMELGALTETVGPGFSQLDLRLGYRAAAR